MIFMNIFISIFMMTFKKNKYKTSNFTKKKKVKYDLIGS